MVSYTIGGMHAKGIWKQVPEANILAQKGCEWGVESVLYLYRSRNIVRVIKSRILRWSGHVARMEEGRSPFKILTGKPTGKIVTTRILLIQGSSHYISGIFCIKCILFCWYVLAWLCDYFPYLFLFIWFDCITK